MPLILWNPVLFNGATRSSVVGSHIDLSPTLLDILGHKTPAGWDGRSLFDPERSPRTVLFAAAWGGYLLGIRENTWKYIYDARTGVDELYELSEDPNELVNVANKFSDRSRRLRDFLGAWLLSERRREEGVATSACDAGDGH